MSEVVQKLNRWEKVTLGEICEVIRGASPRPMGDPLYFTGSIPFLKIADITRVKGKFVSDSTTKVNALGAEKSRLLKKGSLILTNSASVCIPKFLGADACIHDGFVTFQNFNREVNLNFLYYYFDYIRPHVIQTNRQGVTQVNLNTEIVKNFNLLLPLISDQHQIVEKIEELFSELDKGIENLKTVQQQLKVYRQAVLKWAFEGISNSEIKTVEECCSNIVDCLHSTAKFTAIGKCCVDTTCIENGKILFDKVRYVSESTFQERISRLKPEFGDILFAREGTVGTAVIVPKDIDLCLGQRMMMFRLTKSVLPKYFLYYLQSSHFKSQYRPLIMGTTAPHLNIKDIRKFKILTCLIQGQIKIVQEIESRLSVCDKMEETITNSLQQAEALRQSILKRAFEGKLISRIF